MTLPAPVALPLPPGDPAALEDLTGSLSAAAFATGLLAATLTGPAATAPGWLGADAAETARQVGAVAALAGNLHRGVTAAADRLRLHATALAAAVTTVRALRREQADDFAVARARIDALFAETAGRGNPLEVLGDLAAGEASRRRAHDELLAEVATDAAGTAAVLGRASAALGGSGGPGDGVRVLVHLAGLLPGWGDVQLAGLGRAAATGQATASPEELAAFLREEGALLDSPAFAGAFLTGLGADRFAALVSAAGEALRPAELADPLARLVAAASRARAADLPEGPLGEVLGAPLAGPLTPGTAVGLGRLAASGALPPAYLGRVVSGLAAAEREQPSFRRDELAVAAAEDPLAGALAALAATGDADAAAELLADPGLWPGLLGREWTEGLAGLSDLVRLAAAGGDAGDAATGTVLRAVGGSVDVLVSSVTTGSPEAFTVMGISGAVGDLVAAHLPVVTGAVLVGLAQPGLASRPLDDPGRRLLAGLGMVALDPAARASVLHALAQATAAAPLAGPGDDVPAAYAEGGVFAAMAFGEAQEIRHSLYSAVQRAEADSLAWTVVTLPLGDLPVREAWTGIRDGVATGSSFLDLPGTDVAWEGFLSSPATGADQAAYAVVAAAVRPLTDAGLLPAPGAALDHGLGTPEARGYEAGLGDGPVAPGGPVTEEGQRIVLHRLQDGARAGYQDVGSQLGILPGS